LAISRLWKIRCFWPPSHGGVSRIQIRIFLLRTKICYYQAYYSACSSNIALTFVRRSLGVTGFEIKSIPSSKMPFSLMKSAVCPQVKRIFMSGWIFFISYTANFAVASLFINTQLLFRFLGSLSRINDCLSLSLMYRLLPNQFQG